MKRNLDLLDGGDEDAIDDLSASVRTTLCFGRGDRLLLRLCNVFRLEQPTVVVPHTEVPADAPYRIGPLPEHPSRQEDDFGDLLQVSKWMETQAVRLPEAGSRTWNQVLIDFGNTYGAHVSATVPLMLDEIRAYGVAGGTMGGHMLRAAGIVAEHGLASVLAKHDGLDAPTPRDHHSNGVYIGMMGLTAQDEAYFSVSCVSAEPAELFSMPSFEGRRMTGTWEFDAEAGTGSVRMDWSQMND